MKNCLMVKLEWKGWGSFGSLEGVYKYIYSFKDFIFSVLRNNPNLLKQLIAQSGTSKSKLSSLPQGVPLMNGK